MLENISRINIVRIGNCISFSSLQEIGNKILRSFGGMVEEFKLFHHEAPFVESIDALLLTMILHEEFDGHTLGITDADLKTKDDFYNSIFGGKNLKNNVAVVSTRRLRPSKDSGEGEEDYDLYVDRTLKVSLHEVGHNFGLTDHGSYKLARDGLLCPMSRGEYNKFGYLGYVRAIIDGRGLNFCDECIDFLKKVKLYKNRVAKLVEDGFTFASS